MFEVSASIEFFSARPHVLQGGDLFGTCQAVAILFCKLRKSNWVKDICPSRFKISRHCFKRNWQELLVALAHLQIEVLNLTQQAVGLSGDYAPNHSSLVVMVKVISLDAEDGTAGWLVPLPVLGYLILRKVTHRFCICLATTTNNRDNPNRMNAVLAQECKEVTSVSVECAGRSGQPEL